MLYVEAPRECMISSDQLTLSPSSHDSGVLASFSLEEILVHRPSPRFTANTSAKIVHEKVESSVGLKFAMTDAVGPRNFLIASATLAPPPPRFKSLFNLIDPI